MGAGQSVSSAKEQVLFSALKEEYDKATFSEEAELETFRRLRDQFNQISVAPTPRVGVAEPKGKKGKAKRGRGGKGVFIKGLRHSQLQAAPTFKASAVSDKSQETVELLRSALAETLFAADDEADIESVIGAMAEKKCKQGSDVIVQGDKGSEFNVIGDGSLDVIVDGNVVAQLGRGQAFGELALIYDEPVSATIRATADTTLWSLQRQHFRQLQQMAACSAVSQRAKWLMNVPLLAQLDKKQLARVAHSFETEMFPDGQSIMQQGDLGDTFYIIQEGTVSCHKTDANSDQAVEVDRMGPGDFFGEAALLQHSPRTATIKAVGTVSCLVMTKDLFIEVMGPLAQLLENSSIFHSLRRVPALAELSKARTEELVRLVQEDSFAAGDTICEAGEVSKAVYIIKEGCAQCGDKELQAGMVCGGGGLSGEKETLAVTANSDMLCTVLSAASFAQACPDVASGSGATAASALSTEKMCSGPLSKIPRNELETVGLLGEGSFGQVTMVKATNPDTGDVITLAIKRMCKQHIIEGGQHEHIRSERQVLASLSPHPFLLHLYATYSDRDCIYMLTNCLLGGELFSVIHPLAGGDTLPIQQATFYAANVFLALEHLHQAGLIYRDMKPENVLVGSDGYLCIIDMGFAKFVPYDIETDGEAVRHHITYTMCGTPEYMAPEFILQSGHDSAADYWALGVLIHEMLFGRTPFLPEDEDMGKLFKNIAKVKTKKRKGKSGACPPELAFPKGFAKSNPAAVSCIEGFLDGNPTHRLGTRRDGTREIREHEWFADIAWDKMLKKELPVPWLPPVADMFDTSNFDTEESGELDVIQFVEDEECDAFFSEF